MKNKPENLEKEEIDCVALWKAVVLQSILDSCTPIKNTEKIDDIHERAGRREIQTTNKKNMGE